MTLAPVITQTRIAAHMMGGRKTYGIDDAQGHALDGGDVEFARGAFTAIMGPSGSSSSPSTSSRR